jgi:hypothetical protein
VISCLLNRFHKPIGLTVPCAVETVAIQFLLAALEFLRWCRWLRAMLLFTVPLLLVGTIVRLLIVFAHDYQINRDVPG